MLIIGNLDTRGIADDTIVVFTTGHGHVIGHHGLNAKGAFHYEDLLRIPFVVRYPGHVPARQRCLALQSLVYLAPTLLAGTGQEVPVRMQGVDQLPVWTGAEPHARVHVIVENHHQPTAVHLRTYIDQRYKLTIYRDKPWGEMFDLVEDPGEQRNLFHDPLHADLRSTLMHQFLNAELVREPMRYPRVSVA